MAGALTQPIAHELIDIEASYEEELAARLKTGLDESVVTGAGNGERAT